MMTSRATIGVIAVNDNEACTNQGFIICIPNKEYPAIFIYYWLQTMYDEIVNLATGATFKEISRGAFKTLDVLTPQEQVITEFDNVVTPLWRSIRNLLLKNQNLRRTRDLLLPKLISGQLDVSELDIAMGENQ